MIYVKLFLVIFLIVLLLMGLYVLFRKKRPLWDIANGFYCVDGPFGSGKTTLMVHITNQVIANPFAVVFTNIKMNYQASNLYFYPDIVHYTDPFDGSKQIFKHGLLDILEYLHNQYHYQRKMNIHRDERIQFYIFVDEAGFLFNQHNWKNLSRSFLAHLFQIRKYNGRLFFGAQKYKNIAMQFREHVAGVYYVLPSWWSFLPRYKTLVNIRYKEVDSDGNTLMYEYKTTDQFGDPIMKQYPLDEKVGTLHRNKVRDTYDDLYFNADFVSVDPKLDYNETDTYIKGTLKEIKLSRYMQKKLSKRKSPTEIKLEYPDATFEVKPTLYDKKAVINDIVENIQKSLVDN